MADATILNGDIGINYLANNRQKLMYWIGGTNTSYTMNELYSAMATLLDETATIDSGTAFSAETPVEYTTGKIDSGDTEPWFMSFDLMEKITAGALRTSGWTRVTGSNTGIICVPVDTGGDIVAGDRGFDISGGTDGNGTLLEFIDTGATWDYLIIRPDSSDAGDDFTDIDQVITCNTHDAVQWDTAASTTGEMIWANLYSIGTIDANVHLYLYQGVASDDALRNRVYSWNDATQDWYGNSHIDICVALKNIESSTWSIIDDGYVTCFARKYGDLYASFEVANSTTAGGRNPIPLQTSADLDNTSGIKIVTTGVFSDGPYIVGEIITGAVSDARGIVTAQVDGASITYIPIDDPQLEFHSGGAEVITGAISTATATTDASPTDTGPGENTWFTSNTTPTVTFTHVTFDVDDDGTTEDYGITINCQNNPLTEVYEWLKYATRNGEVTDDLDGINGERYIGGEVYLSWTGAVTASIAEGGDVTQAGTGATGVIIAFDDTEKVILLRDIRGTFNTTDIVTDNDNGGSVRPDGAAVTFAAKTASPLGTFAGGTFFGARGVLLSSWISADENSFLLTPIEGGTKERPQAITIEVTNLEGGPTSAAVHDRVSVFRLDGAGGSIVKAEYNAAGGEAPGDSTVTVSGGIAQDVPGKVVGGWLVLVDAPSATGDEYKIRYSSWDVSTFTLANVSAFAATATTTPTIVTYDVGSFITDVERGDLVYNNDVGLSGYVKTVDSDSQLTLEGEGIAGQNDGDIIEINSVPITVKSTDYVYVPFIDRIASAAQESVSIIYISQIFFRVKVRNTRATTKIKPYSSDGTTTGTDQSVPVIRTEDTIIT
jgi:hypothetical protein